MNAPVNAIKLQRGASHRKLALFATGTELRQFEELQVNSLNRLLDLDNQREPSGLRNPNVKLFPHHIRSDRIVTKTVTMTLFRTVTFLDCPIS